MSQNSSPYWVAKEAQNMARHAPGAESVVFQRVALCSMVVMAAAGATQLMLQVIRELRREPHERSR